MEKTDCRSKPRKGVSVNSAYGETTSLTLAGMQYINLRICLSNGVLLVFCDHIGKVLLHIQSKMMRKLCSFHESVKPFWLTCFFFFSFFLLLGHGFSEEEAAEGENPLFDLSNREDMRQMAGYGEERLSTVLVTGSVLCQSCLHGETQLHAWPVAGAVVGVSCHNTGKDSKSSRWVHGATDEFGDFIIDIPSHLHAVHSFENVCSIKILRVPKNTRCRPAHFARQEQLHLSSFGSGIRTYTSGNLRLQHRRSRPLLACINKGSGDQQTSW